MRAFRWFLAAVVTGAVLAVPGPAAANGGAYLEFDRTHYQPGQTAVARFSVAVPEPRQDIFDQGPFYVFLLEDGTLREGRPIPAGAIRLGTLAIDHAGGKRFDLAASFTVPDLPGDFYPVGVCNDPCTISGFRELLSGTVSIVATAREAELLTENDRLASKYYGVRHDLRKAVKEIEGLEALIETKDGERATLEGEIAELEARLASATARARAAERSRPIVDPWAATAVALGLIAVAVGFVLRRRRQAIAVPDTIEEIETMERSAKG